MRPLQITTYPPSFISFVEGLNTMLPVRPSDPLDCLVSPLVRTVLVSDAQPYVPDDYIVDFDDEYGPYYDDYDDQYGLLDSYDNED